MSRRLVGPVLLGLGLVGFPHGALAQQPGDAIVGTWEGAITPQLRIVFHIERGEDGALSGTVDSPDQGSFGSPLSEVTVAGAEVTLGIAVFGASFSGTYADGEIVGTFSQGGANLPLTLTPAAGESEPPARPQEPEPPYPYESEDVSFPNEEAGIALAGTLTRPTGPGPFPGVVLVSGSGPQDRDEALAGHKPFHVLADHLTRAGIAVLRFDDRGVGASEGDFESATSEDFASDALAAVTYLGGLDAVASDRVGIAGHSEGGLIAPMAANRSSDVAFVVLLAGPALPGIDILVAQGGLIGRASGAPQAILDFNARIQRGMAEAVAQEADPERAAELMRAHIRAEIDGLPDALRGPVSAQFGEEAIQQSIDQMNSPWFRFFLHHDPRPALKGLSIPVLSLTGAKDLQVPPELNDPEMEDALARSGSDDVTVRTLPGLNHLFQEAVTGLPTEYAQIEQTMSPVMLGAVSSWILERFAG